MAGQAAGLPPGMREGPWRAPSSPPDTPEPTNNKPFSAHSSTRLAVSLYSELPPSIMMSPRSRRGANLSMKSSTALPATTDYIIYYNHNTQLHSLPNKYLCIPKTVQFDVNSVIL